MSTTNIYNKWYQQKIEKNLITVGTPKIQKQFKIQRLDLLINYDLLHPLPHDFVVFTKAFIDSVTIV